MSVQDSSKRVADSCTPWCIPRCATLLRYEGVLPEMMLYAPFVSVGSFLVVQDAKLVRHTTRRFTQYGAQEPWKRSD